MTLNPFFFLTTIIAVPSIALALMGLEVPMVCVTRLKLFDPLLKLAKVLL